MCVCVCMYKLPSLPPFFQKGVFPAPPAAGGSCTCLAWAAECGTDAGGCA